MSGLISSKISSFEHNLKAMKMLRDQSLAHLDQTYSANFDLGSFANFDRMLEFAVQFHGFVNSAFIGCATQPLERFDGVAKDTVIALKAVGLGNSQLEFKEEDD